MITLILLPHSAPLRTLPTVGVLNTKYVQILIAPPVRQTTAVVNQARSSSRLAAGVVNCYKRSATVGLCCLQSCKTKQNNIVCRCYVVCDDNAKVAEDGPASYRIAKFPLVYIAQSM